ncbi:MAG: hypothetical protein HQL30_09105 [Candidatus Omnitrophica bacterium]|nr:hypothetical protein [Candidatus Omnitrophota bacterium]
MENKCAAESCESKEQSHCKSEECCPVESAIEKWNKSFCQAMHEVQVDILKKKIQSAWGPGMEKAADAVMEAMGVKWQSMLAKGRSHVDLREKMVKIWGEKK